MEIEVGKEYRTRVGEKVKILSDEGCNAKWPYVGNNGITYEIGGSHLYNGEDHNSDLVAPWCYVNPQPANIIAELSEVAQRNGLTITVYHDTAHELKVEFRK